ncbi:hypothetical protein J437_LFUL010338, partial [Ladona fulva]
FIIASKRFLNAIITIIPTTSVEDKVFSNNQERREAGDPGEEAEVDARLVEIVTREVRDRVLKTAEEDRDRGGEAEAKARVEVAEVAPDKILKQ